MLAGFAFPLYGALFNTLREFCTFSLSSRCSIVAHERLKIRCPSDTG